MKRFPVVLWTALLVVVFAACSTSETAIPATPGEDFGPSPPTATPHPSTDFYTLAIATEDGATLVGAFYPPETGPAPGVLLLHMLGHQKEDWAPFATQLQQAGYAVLAMDLRGHGIGSRLVAEAEEWASKREIATLRIRTRTTRNDARLFYEDLGFVLTKTQVVFERQLLED